MVNWWRNVIFVKNTNQCMEMQHADITLKIVGEGESGFPWLGRTSIYGREARVLWGCRCPPPILGSPVICVAKCTFIHLSLSFAYSSSASFCEGSKIQSQEIKEIQRLIVSKWDLFKSYTDKIFKEIHSELIDSFVYIELTICSAQSQSWEFHKKRSW